MFLFSPPSHRVHALKGRHRSLSSALRLVSSTPAEPSPLHPRERSLPRTTKRQLGRAVGVASAATKVGDDRRRGKLERAIEHIARGSGGRHETEPPNGREKTASNSVPRAADKRALSLESKSLLHRVLQVAQRSRVPDSRGKSVSRTVTRISLENRRKRGSTVRGHGIRVRSFVAVRNGEIFRSA